MGFSGRIIAFHYGGHRTTLSDRKISNLQVDGLLQIDGIPGLCLLDYNSKDDPPAIPPESSFGE